AWIVPIDGGPAIVAESGRIEGRRLRVSVAQRWIGGGELGGRGRSVAGNLHIVLGVRLQGAGVAASIQRHIGPPFSGHKIAAGRVEHASRPVVLIRRGKKLGVYIRREWR